MNVEVQVDPAARILRRHGLDASGGAQRFHTQNVLKRIQKYMPYRTGSMIKLTIIQTDINVPEIVTEAPQAKMLFYGRSHSGNPIRYTKTKNPHAGPRWDKAVSAAEGAAMAADLQRYLQRKGS